jgi:hypothetical protein
LQAALTSGEHRAQGASIAEPPARTLGAGVAACLLIVTGFIRVDMK